MGRTGILDGRRRHLTGWAQVGVRGRRGGAARRRRRRRRLAFAAFVLIAPLPALLLPRPPPSACSAPPWSLTTPAPEPHPPGAPTRRPPSLPAGWPAFRSASTTTSPTAQASTANPPAMNRFRRKSESGRSRRKGADSDSNRASSVLDNDAPPPSATDPGTASPSLGLPEFGDFRQSLILVRPLPFSLERCTEPRLTPPPLVLAARPRTPLLAPANRRRPTRRHGHDAVSRRVRPRPSLSVSRSLGSSFPTSQR